MTDIKTDAASLEPGEYVELFDMVLNDNEHLRFYDGQKLKSPGTILWQAMEYYPFPIQAEGFELTSGGRPPRPTLSVSNITGLVGLYAALRDDLVGNTVTRWRTFRHYLDGEPQADPAQHFPPDIFVINRKVSHTSELLTFELSTPFDQTSKVLPGRIAQKRYCPWRYRHYDAEAAGFNYEFAECPYVGFDFYDTNGSPVGQADLDQCGKRLSDCKLRFPNVPLPFGGFPGIRRY